MTPLISCPRSATVLLLGTIAAWAPPAALAAPSLTTNRSCYTAGQRLTLGGKGFQPGSLQTLFLTGYPEAIGTSNPNASGNLFAEFSDGAPMPFEKSVTFRHSRYRVITSSSPDRSRESAGTGFDVVHTAVTFKPNYITPGRVRFRGIGFNTGRDVYVHYLRNGRHVASKFLSRAVGDCGTFRKRARLFLFRPVPTGRYKVIFDNSSTYVRSYAPNFSFIAEVASAFP